MKYDAVEKVLGEKVEAAKNDGESAEYITIKMTFVCPKGFVPYEADEIQSPGPIDSLGEYNSNAIFDPWVESIQVVKRKPVSADKLNKILHGEHKESDPDIDLAEAEPMEEPASPVEESLIPLEPGDE